MQINYKGKEETDSTISQILHFLCPKIIATYEFVQSTNIVTIMIFTRKWVAWHQSEYRTCIRNLLGTNAMIIKLYYFKIVQLTRKLLESQGLRVSGPKTVTGNCTCELVVWNEEERSADAVQAARVSLRVFRCIFSFLTLLWTFQKFLKVVLLIRINDKYLG